MDRKFIVIGAGPAGLTAAYEALRHDVQPLVLEKDRTVGGIARTEKFKGFSFDMGGHRFFTKSREVDRMWREVLHEDFLRRDRLSRIFYNKKFFNYPLKPMNAFLGLGLVESVLILFSYTRWKLFPGKVEETFEQWVTNRFGRRLFLTFFKTYTEKVWGIPCTELKAEWAAQRIKNLSLRTAVLSMFVTPTKTIKTLISAFDYPRLGPGMLWEAVRNSIEQRGGEVRRHADVTAIRRDGMRIQAVQTGINGTSELITGSHFVSSMPLTEFIAKLDPPAPQSVRDAAKQLKYRDFLTVCVVVNQPDLFPDNWIYIHDPDVKVGRIQNFKNWSPAMVPDQSKTSLGLEYFCNEGDDLWTMSDTDLVALARRELEIIGLAKAADVEDGCVFRVPKSYPVYDSGYAEHLAVLREFVDQLENCRTIGRNGLHRYNNQDHSMLTGMYAVRELFCGEEHDLWSVNADMEYHEEVREGDASAAAEGDADEERIIAVGLAQIFGRLDKMAVAVATGAIVGIALLLVTLTVALADANARNSDLALISQFFPGYKITVAGAFVGLGYGLVVGFLCGWVFAAMRNVITFVHWTLVLRRAERSCLRRLLEYV